MPASKLAKNAGKADTTLTRFLNNPDKASPPKTSTLNEIAKYNNLEPYEAEVNQGLSESENPMLSPDEAIHSEDINQEIHQINNDNHLIGYRQKGRSLELDAIVDGDYLLVDANETPKDGDIILVQLRDEQNMTSETTFRIFSGAGEIKAAITATADQTLKRLIVLDGINAVCRGVVKYVIRKKK